MGDALVAGFEFLLLASVYCLVTLPRARELDTRRRRHRSIPIAAPAGSPERG
jgi:hypothetical protein